MSGISQIASKLLGGGSKKAGAGRSGPTGGTTGGHGGSSSSTDAAIGRGVKGLLGKLRR